MFSWVSLHCKGRHIYSSFQRLGNIEHCILYCRKIPIFEGHLAYGLIIFNIVFQFYQGQFSILESTINTVTTLLLNSLIYPGIQFRLPCTPQDNFLWVPNCSLGPPGWETKVSSKKFWFGLCEIAWFLCQPIANLRRGVCL